MHGSSCTLNSNFLLNTSNNNIDEEDEGIVAMVYNSDASLALLLRINKIPEIEHGRISEAQ